MSCGTRKTPGTALKTTYLPLPRASDANLEAFRESKRTDSVEPKLTLDRWEIQLDSLDLNKAPTQAGWRKVMLVIIIFLGECMNLLKC